MPSQKIYLVFKLIAISTLVGGVSWVVVTYLFWDNEFLRTSPIGAVLIIIGMLIAVVLAELVYPKKSK